MASDPIKPCPFCGTYLIHVESWARSFSPPKLYHEIQHPEGDCIVGFRRMNFSDDLAPRLAWIEHWNRRANVSTR